MTKKRVKVPVRSEEETEVEAEPQGPQQAAAQPAGEAAVSAAASQPPAGEEPSPATPPEEALVEKAPEEPAKPAKAEREEIDVEALKAEMERLKEELKQVQQELEDYKDRYLRAIAEMDNMRKRLEKHYADEARREKQRFLRQILPLVDHLEMVVKHSESDPKILHQGVQMILQDLMRTLEMEGVKPIKSVGERFDPFVHEAVEVVETTDVPPDTVVDEVQRGYTYQGDLLRPARVRVARPPAKDTAEKQEAQE